MTVKVIDKRFIDYAGFSSIPFFPLYTQELLQYLGPMWKLRSVFFCYKTNVPRVNMGSIGKYGRGIFLMDYK